MSSKKSPTYTELSDEQVAAAHKDALRTLEHTHLQTSLQLDLAKLAQEPNEAQVAVYEQQLSDTEAQIEHLRKRISELPGAGG